LFLAFGPLRQQRAFSVCHPDDNRSAQAESAIAAYERIA